MQVLRDAKWVKFGPATAAVNIQNVRPRVEERQIIEVHLSGGTTGRRPAFDLAGGWQSNLVSPTSTVKRAGHEPMLKDLSIEWNTPNEIKHSYRKRLLVFSNRMHRPNKIIFRQTRLLRGFERSIASLEGFDS
jgi:hypothetical protein